ncbi:hypothetical protein ACTFIY_008657 [Dictyostelium cf. discoideum]
MITKTIFFLTFLYCEFHSDLPFSRFWGSIYSRVCVREVDEPTEDCASHWLNDVKYIPPINVTFIRLPPTSGGDIIINGTFLRVLGGPNTLEFASMEEDGRFVVKGNFSDPSFNCNSITVTIPPGGGLFSVIFGDYGGGKYDISYAPPIISSIVQDSSKQIITIDGYNFFTENRWAVVKDLYMEKNYTHCFPAIITSISSVSNIIGGIVTIKGSKLSSTLNSSLIPTITIGNKQCKFIKSTTTELECKLDPNESGGKKLSVDVDFNGCSSISSGSTPNLGNNKESFIQLYANKINTKIDKFNISSDQKSLTFKLPQLRCKLFNINFTRNDISLKTISISASLSINVFNKSSLSNGTLFIELYYIDCPISSSSTPTFTVGDSLINQCSIPSLQSSKSDYYQTKCSIPYGTGINRQFTLKYNSEENKTLSCGSIISVSGNNLLTNDEEFKVTVLANNHDTTIIKHDENILTVKYDINESPLNVSVFIGKNLISYVTLTYLEPIITVVPNIKNNKNYKYIIYEFFFYFFNFIVKVVIILLYF